MKFVKNNIKYCFIYLAIIILFTAFYLALFTMNRLAYMDSNLESKHEKIMNAVSTISDIGIFLSQYQLSYFMDYVALLEHFYKNDKANLHYFLDKNTMYVSIAIVDKNAKPIFAKADNLDLAFDVLPLLNGDDIKTTITFDDYYGKVYKVFVYPMSEDIYIVAYLDVDTLYGANDFYVVSKEGELLSKSKQSAGFDNFALHYPKAWEHIVGNHRGQVVGDENIFIYHALNGVDSINGIDVTQESRYLIFVMPINPKDNPYSINSISSFIKYADFHSNIIYWLIGYAWIFFTSIVVFVIIINRLKNVKSLNIDEKYGILDIDSGFVRLKRLARGFSASGIVRIFIYFVSIFVYFKKPIQSIHLCKVCIDGLKQISINLDNKHRDEIMIKTISIIKENLTKDDMIIRMSFDEFLIVFIDKDIDFIHHYYSDVCKNATPKNYDFKHNISTSHGIIKYAKKEDIYTYIKEAGRIANIEKKSKEINLFFN